MSFDVELMLSLEEWVGLVVMIVDVAVELVVVGSCGEGGGSIWFKVPLQMMMRGGLVACDIYRWEK